MSLGGHACATCCRNCSLLHRRKGGSSSTIPSFFKILFYDTFDQFLVLPPEISEKLKSLDGRKMTLTDCMNQSWEVRLSNVNDDLRFRKGWNHFALDHNLEIGDLLMFYRVAESRFLVEIYGKSGCPKHFTVDGMSTDTTETTKRYVPNKRMSDPVYEQSPPKRHRGTSAFPAPSIDVTPRPKYVPSVMTGTVPNVVHIRDSPPKVLVRPKVSSVPKNRSMSKVSSVPENRFMSNRDTNRSKVRLVPENRSMSNRDTNRSKVRLVPENRSMSNRDTNRPKVVPVPETLADPCSLSNQYKTRSQLVEKAEMVLEPCFMTTRYENNTVKDDRDRLFDLSAFEMPGNKSTFVKKEKEVESEYQNADSEATAFTDLHDCQDVDRNIEAVESDASPFLSITSLKTIEVYPEFAALSGENVRCIQHGSSTSKQDVRGDAKVDCSSSGTVFTNEGTNTSRGHATGNSNPTVKTEAVVNAIVEYNPVDCHGEDVRGDAKVDCSSSGTVFTNEQTKTSRGHAIDNSNPTVKTEAVVNAIVEFHPVDCHDLPAPTVKVTCSDTEDFLELPEPLPIATSRTRARTAFNEQPVFLRDSLLRVWPVLYQYPNEFKILTSGWKSFLKANCIEPGDQCSFTLENKLENIIVVHVDPQTND